MTKLLNKHQEKKSDANDTNTLSINVLIIIILTYTQQVSSKNFLGYVYKCLIKNILITAT